MEIGHYKQFHFPLPKISDSLYFSLGAYKIHVSIEEFHWLFHWTLVTIPMPANMIAGIPGAYIFLFSINTIHWIATTIIDFLKFWQVTRIQTTILKLLVFSIFKYFSYFKSSFSSWWIFRWGRYDNHYFKRISAWLTE